MIASLEGIIREKEENRAIIEVAGVGYEVLLPLPASLALASGAMTRIFTVEVQREDGRELFGFLDLPSRSLFRKLINISGVGPRTALAVLSTGSLGEVQSAIDQADLSRLTSVPGIGAKTAQKIILELKGKLVPSERAEDYDAIEALVGLGYSRAEASKAVQSVGADIEDSGEKVRAALRVLGKK